MTVNITYGFEFTAMRAPGRVKHDKYVGMHLELVIESGAGDQNILTRNSSGCPNHTNEGTNHSNHRPHFERKSTNYLNGVVLQNRAKRDVLAFCSGSGLVHSPQDPSLRRCQITMSSIAVPLQLQALLSQHARSEGLDIVLAHVLRACMRVGVALRSNTASTQSNRVGSTNQFGDEQLAVDVTTDEIFFDELTQSRLVRTAASEEKPDETTLSTSDVRAGFSAAFDPLDGSSSACQNCVCLPEFCFIS
jgi:hypothetical protein